MNPFHRVPGLSMRSLAASLPVAAFVIGFGAPVQAADPCGNATMPSKESFVQSEEARDSSYAILESGWKNSYEVGNLNQTVPQEACFWGFLKKQEVTNEDWDKYPAAVRRHSRCWQSLADRASSGCDLWTKTRDSLKETDRIISQDSQDPAQLKSKYAAAAKDFKSSRGTLLTLWFTKEDVLIKWLDHKKSQLDSKLAEARSTRASARVGDTASVKNTQQTADTLRKASPSQTAAVLNAKFDNNGRAGAAPGGPDDPGKAGPGAAAGSGQGAGGVLAAKGVELKEAVAPPKIQEAGMVGALSVVGKGATGTYVRNAAGKLFLRQASGALVDVETGQAVTAAEATAAAGGAWTTTTVAGFAVPTVAVVGAGAVAVTGLALGGAYLWQKRENEIGDASLRVANDFQKKMGEEHMSKLQAYDYVHRMANSSEVSSRDRDAYAKLKEKLDQHGWGGSAPE